MIKYDHMSENSGMEKGEWTFQYQNIDELRKKLNENFEKYKFKKEEKLQHAKTKEGLSRRRFLKFLGATAALTAAGALGIGTSIEAGRKSGSPEGFLNLVREKAEKLYEDSHDSDSLYDNFYALLSAMHKGYKPPEGYGIEISGIFSNPNISNFERVTISANANGINVLHEGQADQAPKKLGTPIEIFNLPITRDKKNMLYADITIAEPFNPFPAKSVPEDLLSPLGNTSDILRYKRTTFSSAGDGALYAHVFGKRKINQISLYTSDITDPAAWGNYEIAENNKIYPNGEKEVIYTIYRKSDRLESDLEEDKFKKTDKALK